MKYLRHIFAIVLIALLLAGCKKSAPNEQSDAYAVSRDFYNGPLRVQVSLSSDAIKLSDLINLKLLAQIDTGNNVEFPQIADQLKDFKLRTEYPLSRRLADNGKLSFEQVFEIEPLKPGQCQIPELTIRFGKDGSLEELKTEPFAVEVTTSLPPGEQSDIADIEDIVDVPPSRWPIWAGIGGAAILITAVIAYTLRPKKPVVVKRIYRSAHEIALDVLHSLAAEKLIEKGQTAQFYYKLSGCLRQYIENRFALRAPEQTTEEFLSQLSTSDALQPEHKVALRQFLEHCDLVKFARYQPTIEQTQKSLQMAEQFVENTKSPEHVIDVTDSKQEVA